MESECPWAKISQNWRHLGRTFSIICDSLSLVSESWVLFPALPSHRTFFLYTRAEGLIERDESSERSPVFSGWEFFRLRFCIFSERCCYYNPNSSVRVVLEAWRWWTLETLDSKRGTNPEVVTCANGKLLTFCHQKGKVLSYLLILGRREKAAKNTLQIHAVMSLPTACSNHRSWQTFRL